MANLENLSAALSNACEAARGASFNAAILYAVAFIILGCISFLAYKKHAASKDKKWFAALLLSAILSALSLVFAMLEFMKFNNFSCP